MVPHTYTLSNWEVETEDQESRLPLAHTKFKVIQDYILDNNKKKSVLVSLSTQQSSPININHLERCSEKHTKNGGSFKLRK